jgi:uncharacterized membrane protein
MDAADIPPGWDRNPSAWPHRLPVAGLALLGFLVAGYLALYQWGVFPTVWEPLFGNGSERVLHSWVSRLLPIPDAALGALAYLAELVAALVGGHDRWRTFPWAVVVYGGLAAMLGVAAVTLMIFQPVFFGTWCTLCLTSAAVSILLAAWAVDEVWAAWKGMRGEGWGMNRA